MKIKIIIFALLLLVGYTCYGQTVSALVNNPDLFDGKTVIVKGELVGDIIEGKDGFWVNLLDSGVAIGIYLPYSEKGKIKFLGKYDVTGDFVKIKGVFHKRCIEHAGDTDIHSVSMEVISQGMKKEEEIPVEKIIFAFSLGIVGLAAIGILHILTRREAPGDD